MKKLVLALIVVAAMVMSLATVSTASAITLILPNGDNIDVPDAAIAAGASPVIQAPPAPAP